MFPNQVPDVTPIDQHVVADPGNSSTQNVNAGDTFTGLISSTLGVAGIQVMLKATVASGTCSCTVYVDQSGDGINFDISDSYSYLSNREFGITVQAVGSYYRVRVTNTSSGNTTAFRLFSALCPIVEVLPRTLDARGHLVTSNYPYELMLARGLVPNNIAVTKFGRNPDIDVGSEDIWSQGGNWVPPTTARVHAIVSSNDEDGGAGTDTGALTMSVNGLNGSYVDTTETVTLNGTTSVNTANSYIIIHRMIVLTAGSTGANLGTITATAAVDGTVSAAIVIGKNQTQLAIYQIPAGYTGYLWQFGGSMNGGANANVDLELFAKPFGGVYNLKGTLNMTTGSGVSYRDYHAPQAYTEKTIIKLRGTSDTVNSNVVGNFDITLVAN